MLKDNVRYCDVCEEIIEKDQRYAVSVIPRQNVEKARAVLPCEGTLDPSGNLRFELCLDCRMNMSFETDDVVH